MVDDVKKPKSTHSLIKLTSQQSPPPGRDNQHNNNQTILISTTKDQDIDIPPNVFNYNTATTTATTADQNRNQKDLLKMTLEEIQQWEEENYKAEDRAEEAVNPNSNWIILAAMAFHSDIFLTNFTNRNDTHTTKKSTGTCNLGQ